MNETTIIDLVLKAPSIGALVFIVYLKSKENTKMAEAVEKLAAAVNKQSGILIGLTKGNSNDGQD